MYIQLKEFSYEGKVVLYAYIPESSSVHTLHGTKIFDRNEDGDYDITKNQNLIAKMYARKSNRKSEDRIIPQANKDWFDSETVKMVKDYAYNVDNTTSWSVKKEAEILTSPMFFKHDAETGIEGYTLELPLKSEKEMVEERTSVKEKILDYVATNHEITNKDVRDNFGFEKTRAAELLSELMDENLLRREGSGRGTKYVPAKG